MNLTSVITAAVDMAEKLVPALEGTPVGAIVEAGQAAVNLIHSIKDVAGESDQATLQASLDKLEPQVQAHLDKTITDLG